MKRALIVIDVQNEHVDGQLKIGYPSPGVSLPNIVLAMDAAVDNAIPVAVIQQTAPSNSPVFGEGGRGAELHGSIADRTYGVLLEKQLPSAFAGTGLAEWLNRFDVDTVAIVGYATETCGSATARDASHLGMRVELLSDATGALLPERAAGSGDAGADGAAAAKLRHESVLAELGSKFTVAVTTRQWLEAVRTSTQLAGVRTGTSPSKAAEFAS